MLIPDLLGAVSNGDGTVPMMNELQQMQENMPEGFGLHPAPRYRFCHKTREFVHRIVSSPLFFALSLFLIFNVIFLLMFVCIRCRARRIRSAAFKRQIDVSIDWKTIFV